MTSITPAATPLVPKLQPIAEPARLEVAPTGRASLYAQPRPGSAPTDVPVIDAVASSMRNLTSLTSAPDARAATGMLRDAATDLLVARRGALDVGISTALDRQLTDAAAGLASLSAKVATAPPSTPFVVATPVPKELSRATTALDVLADHVTRVDRQNASGVYL